MDNRTCPRMRHRIQPPLATPWVRGNTARRPYNRVTLHLQM
jgi:hypothetical protein